ncbi:MAG: hypothetical protein BMS9Abin36_1677 [Gammaproteobacteria bacterium]|nr:MAG: hypothetical protein BMS9Abin36_1677 [Gammaproteobacteria bacterium]
MAVIIRKKVTIENSEVEMESYEPPGILSKKERLRADRLDEILREHIPEIARDILKKSASSGQLVQRWYLLGRELRKIVEDRDIVASSDIENGGIWPAIWQYLPDSLKPQGLLDADSYTEYKHRRKDHLRLGYEISEYDWEDIDWIRRLEDWYQIASRPGLVRDKRILRILGRRIKDMAINVSSGQIREIAKDLVKAFPTRKFRDSSQLSEKHIETVVSEVVDRICKRNET